MTRWSVVTVVLVLVLSFLFFGGGDALASGLGSGPTVDLIGRRFDPLDGSHPLASGSTDLILIQFRGPVTRRAKAAVRTQGARLLAYIPHDAFIARLEGPERNPALLQALPQVRWVGDYLPEYKISPTLLVEPLNPKAEIQIDAELAPWADAVAVGAAVRRSVGGGVVVTGIFRKAHRYRIRFRVSGGLTAVTARAIADLPTVLSVVERPEPELLNDNSVWVVQNYDIVNGPTEATATEPRQYPVSATVWGHGILGEGQYVAVADSGMNEMCFFEYGDGEFPTAQELTPPDTGPDVDYGRKVIAYYVEPGAAAFDHSSQSYHGTHVSGSVAGDNHVNLASETAGTPNHDSGDGMAPGAQLIMQDVGSSSGLSGLSGDLTDMFEQAYAVGARIHTNSWGSTTADYTSDAQDMDEMMWRREDIVFTVAMGNSGTGPGDSSIGAPATAKNVVSVGGVTNGGSTTRADRMTTYSRGPTSDGRLKPDVVSPASSIRSAYGGSSCSTTTLSGTSMATPTTAGSLALLREYFTRGFWKNGAENGAESMDPSGALMKAALITGATPLGEVDGTDPLAGGGAVSLIPSMDQGWGRTHLEGSLYFAGDDERVRYWDVRRRDGVETGDSRELHVDVPAGSAALAVTLAWSDPPAATAAATALVNDLDLEVVAPDGSTTYLGNVFSGGWSVTGGTPDRLNPVEGVRVQAPSDGTWTIRVRGYSVPGTGLALNSDRQGFAVVARFGECSGGPPPAPTGLGATNDAPNGVQLAWTGVAGAERYLVYKAVGDCTASPDEFTFLGESSGPAFTDDRAYGGYTTAYHVVADGGCGLSGASGCASVTYDGPCDLHPSFDGLEGVSNTGSIGSCGLLLGWSAAETLCPNGSTARYNVYRSTDPLFDPGLTTLLTTTTTLGFEDDSVVPGQPYYYIVRAEDSTTGGPGPNGGNEEQNLVRFKGVSWAGSATAVEDFVDDGGDTTAWLDNESPWTITASDNHTAAGAYSYRSAVEGENYPAGTCASLTTPPLELVSGQTHTLSYWARYNIEEDWDGVVVEISSDGGSTWSDLPPSGGYPGDFSQTGSPPINACGYASTHGAFNGPTGNAAPTEWTEYTADLSSWDGQTVLIRWNLSTDPGAEFEGFWLDDITVSNVKGPGRCGRSDGVVLLDAEAYSCSASVGIALDDADLMWAGTATVTATSSEGDVEDVVLNEVPAGSAHFEGVITTASGGVVAGNGSLEVAGGGSLQVEYIDADDGLGGTNVSKTASASVDCQGPLISDLAVSGVGAVSALVTWTTDEPADSGAMASPGGATGTSSALVTSHAVLVEGLDPCTTYTASVSSTDAVGNTAVGGPTVPFRTLDGAVAIDDDAEGGSGAWTVDTAQDPGSGSNWAITESGSAHSPTHVWFTADEAGVKDDRLVAGPISIGTGSTLLTFWHDYTFEGSSTHYDGGVLEVSTDGTTWEDVIAAGGVFESGGYDGVVSSCCSNPIGGQEAWTASSGGMMETRVDLSALAGSDVWIRFRLGCDSSVASDGWYLDDILLETTGPCPCTGPSFAGVESATAVSGQPEAALSWSAATDECGTGSLEYLIFIGIDGPVDWGSAVASSSGLSTVVQGLTPGTSYYFGVRARDGLGNVDGNTVELGPVVAEGSRPAGDADCDGSLTSADMLPVVEVIFGATPGTCSAEDANGDGSVNAADPAQIVRYLFDGV